MRRLAHGRLASPQSMLRGLLTCFSRVPLTNAGWLAPVLEPSLSTGTRLFSEAATAPVAAAGAGQGAKPQSRRLRQLRPKLSQPREAAAQLPVRRQSDSRQRDASRASVQALFLGREIDMSAVQREYSYAVLHSSRDFSILSSSIKLKPSPASSAGISPSEAASPSPAGRLARLATKRRDNDVTRHIPCSGVVVVFQFGAAVFFAAPTSSAAERALQEAWTTRLQPHVTEPVTQPLEALEDIQLVLQPSLGRDVVPGADQVLVKNWDLGNLETVSRVVGQSVALDYYHSTVDDQSCLVERLVERIGDRHSMELLSSWREGVRDLATTLLSQCRRLWPPFTRPSAQRLQEAQADGQGQGYGSSTSSLGATSVSGGAQHCTSRGNSGSGTNASSSASSSSSGGGGSSSGNLGGTVGSSRMQPSAAAALPVHATSRMLVALLCDLIQFHATVTKKLGMLDKDHTPWESDKHERVWQSLRRYYDIDKRDHALLTKLEAVRQRVQFLLELHNGKTTHRMELTIVILITMELLVNLTGFHMGGTGLH
ncbi:hypothetical protein V8C86DRAFT_2581291 [Haematococcus lacustris]